MVSLVSWVMRAPVGLFSACSAGAIDDCVRETCGRWMGWCGGPASLDEVCETPQKPAKSVNRGLQHRHLVCPVVNFFINNMNIKLLHKITVRVKHADQNLASCEARKNVTIYVSS